MLVGVGAVVALVGALYALALLSKLTHELGSMNAKLETMSAGVHSLNVRMGLLQETNRRLTAMQKDTAGIPTLTQAMNEALRESSVTNSKLEVTNLRLASADTFLRDTTTKLLAVHGSLQKMEGDVSHMSGAMDTMSAELPALGDMRGMLADTNASIGKASAGVDRVTAGLGQMQTQMADMNTHLSVLPTMNASLDAANQRLDTANLGLTNAVALLQPMKESLPMITSSMQRLDQTTQDMSASVKKLTKKGSFAVGILTIAGLVR